VTVACGSGQAANPVEASIGFTLIELLVVIAIIAIFGGIAIARPSPRLNRRDRAVCLCQPNLHQMSLAFAYVC